MTTFSENASAVALGVVAVLIVGGLILLPAVGADIPDALSAAAGAVLGVLGKSAMDKRSTI